MDVTVRDLKEHLSAVLKRAQAGETVLVTSHRRPVAQLVPPPPAGDDAAGPLLAAGLISERPRPGGLGPRVSMQLPPGAGNLSDAVIEDRG
jgi:prevent-host-death family protein